MDALMAEDSEDGGEGRSTDDEDALMKEWAAMAGGDEDDASAATAAVGGDAADGDGGGDADSVAAEWEAMLGAGDDDADGGDGDAMGPGPSTRVLNQDEIDSLLGFDDSAGGSGDRSGIQAILNSALVSYERLPMLEVVFDRLVRMMSTRMRKVAERVTSLPKRMLRLRQNKAVR